MTRMYVRAALLSCAVLAVGPAMASHSWGNYHWARQANPFTLKVVDAVSPAWDSYLDEAIADWTASSVLNLTEEPGSSVNARRCRAISGKVLACNASYGQNGWLGLASIWASGSHITQATTKVNDSYFSLASYNKPEWRRLVMCQEIAHDFGLAHQDENFSNGNLGSCMDYTSNPKGPPSNEHPNAHDFAQLETIYGHVDTTTTISASPAATNFGIREVGQPAGPASSPNDPGDSPAEWGRAVGSDGQGRPNLFVQELGGGNRKITHVFWAIGEGPKGGHHDDH